MVSRRQLLKLSALGTATFAAPLAYSASNTTMTHKNGSPLGSPSLKDVDDNARSLDLLVCGDSPTYMDRRGVQRRSWAGMEGEFSAEQERRNSDFNKEQALRDAKFNKVIASNGYLLVGDYIDAPFEIGNYNQYILRDGRSYSLSRAVQLPYLVTGDWEVEGASFVLIGDDILREDLADKDKGAGIVGYMWRTVRAKLDDFISITDYYVDGDAGRWHFAYARAVAVTPKIRFPYRHDINYVMGECLDVPSDGVIFCDNGVTISSPPAVNAAGSDVITLIKSEGKERITLVNLRLDGGVREVMTDKSYVRPVRFVECKEIACFGLEIINNPDWSLSFERCDGVRMAQYKQKSYVYDDPAVTVKLAGGRDGLHFQDCKNVYVSDLDIESGDDCVGITSKDLGCFNINIRGVRGISSSASVVIYNEEFVGGEYVAKNLEQLIIEDVQVKHGAVVRSVVRVIKYNSESVVYGVSIKGVRGKSANHGLHLGGVGGLKVDDVNVVSVLQHGVYMHDCIEVNGCVHGKSMMAGFDGVNINGGSNIDLIAYSNGSANFGVHILGVTDSVIVPFAKDCGGGVYDTASGGNGRMVNCVGVEMPYGVLSGDKKISYYGLVLAGNTDCRIGRGVKIRGYINNVGSANPVSMYIEPAAAVRFKESCGELTVSSPYNCKVDMESEGVYKIVFLVAMRSTLFNYQITAQAVGDVRNIQLVSNPTTSEVVFATIDSKGKPASSDIVSFLAYDS